MGGNESTDEAIGARMTPVDLRPYYNWPPEGGPERTRAEGPGTTGGGKVPGPLEWWAGLRKKVDGFPAGRQTAWGIPFSMGPAEGARVILARNGGETTVEVNGKATHLCVLHLFEQTPDRVDTDNPRENITVAEYVLRREDGVESRLPVRTRYEVAAAESPGPPWLAQPFDRFRVVDPAAPDPGCPWGFAQYGLFMGHRFEPRMPYVCAIANPASEKTITSVTIRGLSESPLLVAALTLYIGGAHPLAYLPRRIYRITVDGSAARIRSSEIDLGLIARIERAGAARDDRWLARAGLPEASGKATPGGALDATGEGESLLHITAARDAVLHVDLERGGNLEKHRFSVGEAHREDSSRSGAARLEVLGGRRQWMRVRVIDDSTGRPTPARIHFSGSRGEYIAPYGHHEQINTNWFEDYGADVAWGGRNYAYVPGDFTTDLPVGELYVEVSKGFEYTPVRRRVRIEPGQDRLDLRIDRWIDLREAGWVTADTHVHFISPQTAWLEGQAEGVNVVNLLASQWGRLFTNIGDLSGRVGVVEDDTIVYVGTENRNHMLGHMSMLGTAGPPVYPMCGGGPSESWVGDPDFSTMADWARENRRRGGLVIRPHFPWVGFTEDPVPIIQGLVDALEIGIGPASILRFATQEWYRYLNCGYRVAVVGGTDKMSARQALGALRTYARIGTEDELTYERWRDAVRTGRTISTSGPLLDLQVDGRSIGDTITMPQGGGTVEIVAMAQAFHPIGFLEIVFNGKVVAAVTGKAGARELSISERLIVPASGWIAARCGGLETQPITQNAHTSPIYVSCGDERIFDGPAAEHMLALVEGGITYLDTMAACFDEATRKRMVRQFREAQKDLRIRLDAAGHVH